MLDRRLAGAAGTKCWWRCQCRRLCSVCCLPHCRLAERLECAWCCSRRGLTNCSPWLTRRLPVHTLTCPISSSKMGGRPTVVKSWIVYFFHCTCRCVNCHGSVMLVCLPPHYLVPPLPRTGSCHFSLLGSCMHHRFGDNTLQDHINARSFQHLSSYCMRYKEHFGSASELARSC